jgi:hypothetical protein
VIHDSKRRRWPPRLPSGLAKRRERLRARIFVQHRAIDVEQHLTAIVVEPENRVAVDELVIERALLKHWPPSRAFPQPENSFVKSRDANAGS